MLNINQPALEAVKDGIYKFSRMTALRQHKLEEKWIQDELDLLFVLGIVKTKFRDTLTMIGKVKYKDTKHFDFTRDVKEEVEEFLFSARTEHQQLLNKKRHLVMYHLVVEPVIDMFKDLSHQEAVLHGDEIIDSVIDMIINNDVVSTYDDAIVTREIVRKQVQERETARKAQKTRQRRAKVADEKLEKEATELEELMFE